MRDQRRVLDHPQGVSRRKEARGLGWIYTHRDTRESLLQFFQREFHTERVEVLDCAPVGFCECYVALRLAGRDYPEMPGDPVVAVAVMTHHSQGYYNFGYKAADETMGPCIDRCPERIMRMLTPIRELVKGGVYSGDSQASWSRQWRLRCWKVGQSRSCF